MKKYFQDELTKLAKNMEGILTREEFEQAFKMVLDFVKKIGEENTKRWDDLNAQYSVEGLRNNLETQANERHSRYFGELKSFTDQSFSQQKAELQKEFQLTKRIVDDLIKAVRAKMASVKNGQDGLRGSPDTPKEVRNKLESLARDERLDKTAIKGIEELEKEIEDLKSRPTRMGGGGFSAIAMQQHILPWTEMTGTVDGSNTTFTLGQAPNPTNSLEVMVGGSPLFLTDDFTYTASTRTVEFLTAPPSGAKVRYKCLL